MAAVGENGFHTVEVTSKSDDLTGDDITIQYYKREGTQKTDGQTQIGVKEGGTMAFVTDFEDKQIDPGLWYFQFVRDDNGTTRQVAIQGTQKNKGRVEVTDAVSL